MTNTTLKYKFPSEFAEKIGIEYSNSTSNDHKKESGQFFTSKGIADFMGNLAQPKSTKNSILDPGCGTAILSCSLIEKLIEKYPIKEINLSLFETDKKLIEKTEEVISVLKNWLQKKDIKLYARIEQADFVLFNSNVFSQNSLFGFDKISGTLYQRMDQLLRKIQVMGDEYCLSAFTKTACNVGTETVQALQDES